MVSVDKKMIFAVILCVVSSQVQCSEQSHSTELSFSLEEFEGVSKYKPAELTVPSSPSSSSSADDGASGYGKHTIEGKQLDGLKEIFKDVDVELLPNFKPKNGVSYPPLSKKEIYAKQGDSYYKLSLEDAIIAAIKKNTVNTLSFKSEQKLLVNSSYEGKGKEKESSSSFSECLDKVDEASKSEGINVRFDLCSTAKLKPCSIERVKSNDGKDKFKIIISQNQEILLADESVIALSNQIDLLRAGAIDLSFGFQYLPHNGHGDIHEDFEVLIPCGFFNEKFSSDTSAGENFVETSLGDMTPGANKDEKKSFFSNHKQAIGKAALLTVVIGSLMYAVKNNMVSMDWLTSWLQSVQNFSVNAAFAKLGFSPSL